MTHFARSAVLVAVLVATLGACAAPPDPKPLPGVGERTAGPPYEVGPDGRIVKATVTVSASCAGGTMTLTVHPYRAMISPGGTIQWNVIAPGAGDVEVYPKMGPGKPWPFGNASLKGKAKGAGNPPAASGAQGVKGDLSQYGIRFRCVDDATEYDVDLDPDIIIVGTM